MNLFKSLFAALTLSLFAFGSTFAIADNSVVAPVKTGTHAVMIVMTFVSDTLEILTADTYGFPSLDACRDNLRNAVTIVTPTLQAGQQVALECTSIKTKPDDGKS